MNIRRVFAENGRQAARKLRDELGPDAVILSNRRVEGGVEIVAASEFDEEKIRELEQLGNTKMDSKPTAPDGASAGEDPEDHPSGATLAGPRASRPSDHPGAGHDDIHRELAQIRKLLERQNSGLAWANLRSKRPNDAELLARLMDFGLDSPICSRYLELGKLDDSPELSEDAVSQRMAAELVVAPNAILADGGVFAFVGPTGVGKTTTVAKLAARYLLRHGAGKVALITTDFRRVGAFEQIRTFANILNVPLAQARSESELEAALDDFSDYPLVLIDTAGIGQRDVDLCKHFSPLTANRTRIRNYLVVASNAQAGAIDETAAAFRGASLEGCVITKLDEARRIGGVISMLIKTKIPVAFLSDGQRVPEDLHPADADVLISGGWALLEHRGMPDEDALALAFGDALANAHG